jgi:methionyl-tRNA synthetase
MADASFYISTPIYYVNDKPHIGHAYTTILADVLARYHRLLGDDTFFLTGTDEHGQKIAQAAAKAGITPQQQADRTVVRFQELWEKLDITNTDFIRTTEERHKRVVQEILQDLYDRDEIYKAEYDGWYDVTSETFVTDREALEAGGDANPNLTRIKESNYFFRMSKYQDWLIEHIEKHPEFIQPDYRRNETLGFLRKPLNDLCISRPKSRMDWGIDLPFDDAFVTYVWFDALVNYISAVGYRRDDVLFAKWWPVSVHLIGKDILTTHTVYWPTMLKAMGVEQPQTIFAHGWWLSGASKMSKSLGNVVNPMAMIDKVGVDAFRYFLIAEMSLGQDASFTEDLFVRRFNADLANDLGNLVSRVIKMIRKNAGGVLPDPGSDALGGEQEGEVWGAVQAAVEAIHETVPTMRLDQGLAQVMGAVRAANRYLEYKQPWSLAKRGEQAELERTLYVAAEALRVISALLYPVMPERMAALRAALGVESVQPLWTRLREFGVLSAGAAVADPGSLFPRVKPMEQSMDQELPITESSTNKPAADTAATAATPSPAKPEAKPTLPEGVIDYEHFAQVQLRTARIVSAEKIEGASKLLKVMVRLGEESRQLVAGIAHYYTPEELLDKTVVVVTNLKPAVIRGVESQGMLLAATKGESLRLITIDGNQSSGGVVR